jgi:cytochrome P450
MKSVSKPQLTFTSYGTNAASLTWTLYSLATNPEIQDKLRAEIRSVRKSPHEPVTAAEMDAMKYLHCVTMESTRLYPSVPGTWREAVKDVVIEGVPIKRGTQTIISTLHMNRSKAVWGADAEKFVPERWEPERRIKGVEHDGRFLSYLIGHKACIGKEYSLRAIKTVMLGLIGDFEFSYEGPDPYESLVSGITMRPKGGLKLKVRPAPDW